MWWQYVLCHVAAPCLSVVVGDKEVCNNTLVWSSWSVIGENFKSANDEDGTRTTGLALSTHIDLFSKFMFED